MAYQELECNRRSKIMPAQPATDGVESRTDRQHPGGIELILRRVLANPIMGFAPWIAFSVLEGPKRYELATVAALAIAVVELLLGLVVGARAKLLDVVAIVFFVAMLIAGGLVDSGGQAWLDRWSGELSNVMLVAVALASIALRSPFTIQYAREMTPEENWTTPLFFHINYVITWVWTATFAITALVGWYGDGPLNQPDNIWTNWIVQIAVLVFAIRFTDWYPDVATARALPASEQATQGHPDSIAGLFLPLASYLVPIGIVILVFDAAPSWSGIALIVCGILLTRFLHTESSPELSSTSDPSEG
jgi:hypothetical protein